MTELGPDQPADESRSPQLLSREARDARDKQVVQARLSGTAVSKVAKEFGITTRHLRRIMESHRNGNHEAAPAAVEALEEGIAEIDAEIAQLKALSAKAKGKRKTELVLARSQLLDDRISMYSNAGMLPPGSFDTSLAVAGRARAEQVASTNRVLRTALAEHGLKLAAIEDIIEQVVEASGVEDGREEPGLGSSSP